MMMSIAARLAERGIVLPPAAAAVANYVPTVLSGSWLIISGQLPFGADGTLDPRFRGRLGENVAPEVAAEAARWSALNCLAQAARAVGSLDRVARCLRLGGFINAAPDFTALPPIMNGASDALVEVFGEAGRHARTTVGVASLPLGAVVEVEAMFEVRP
jgi:enamine deaminase RidA (YjgF/YER057c/UK114 family)